MPSFRAFVVLFLAAGIAIGDEPKPEGVDGFLKGLKFRPIGPSWGGRACRVCGVPGDPLTYYAATAMSGVWKSTDGGLNWKPIFDDQPCASAGSIAVAPSDPNVVYVGAGEANIRGNVLRGDGIYKSTDAGKTWSHVWKQAGQIGTIVVHPTNADIAYAAVLGSPFAPNRERGVFRTVDGGKNWKQVLFKDPEAGASDIAMNPNNPRILFAGIWETRRRPWTLTSGGPSSGLYVSRDAGDTWKRLEGNGLPKGPLGRIGVAVAPSDGARVYALIEANEGGLFRSDDGGENWKRTSDDRLLRQRAWYYTTLTVDPSNPDVVWAPNVPLLKSIDGGKTFAKVGGTHHGDHHDVWIDPKNPKRMIEANDGGVDVSTDGGGSWYAPRLPWGQFYRINVDSRKPYHVTGTLQDIGAGGGPSDTLASGGINVNDWYNIGGGEAGYTASDPKDPNIVYAGEYDGILTRYDHRTGLARHIGAYPFNSSGHGAEDKQYRFRWPAPMMISPHDPKAVFHAGNALFRTTDGGQSWTKLSPDLTRDDKSKQRWSGGPITGDNTGAEHFCTLSAIAESPLKKGVLWTGSDDGLVQVSQDDGKTWKNVTAAIEGLPEWGTVQHIEPSRRGPGAAYVVVDAHLLDDFKPYVWKTEDFGKSWKPIALGFAKDSPVHVLREDPAKPSILYAGTDRGVMVSFDAGAKWEKLRLNLPTVPVHDLRVTDKDLVVGTMGRSAWILDDVAALRTRSAVAETAKVHLFAPPPATLWGIRSGAKLPGAGENPPHGATITYWLKEDAPASGVKIEILDGKGAVIAELQGEKPKDAPPEPEVPESFPKRPLPAKKGMHRVTWNFAELPPDRIPRGALDAGNLSVGPRALPGRYVVRLSASGQKSNAALVLERDPRSAVSAEQLAEQHRFATTVKDDLGKLTYAVQRIRLVRKQLADRNGVLKETKTGKELVADSAKLIAALEDLEGKLHNPKAKVVYDILAFKGGAQLYSQMASLYSFATDAEGAPTQGMKEVFDGYRKRLGAALDEVEKTFSGAVERNQALAAKGKLPGIVIPPAKKPAPEPEAPPRKQKPVEKKPKEKKKPKKNAPPKGSSGS